MRMTGNSTLKRGNAYVSYPKLFEIKAAQSCYSLEQVKGKFSSASKENTTFE